MTLQLSHFSAALIFAFFASTVVGITPRSEQREMIKYGAKCFVFFVVGTIAAGWVMWILRH
jgi:hypothetical protein